MLDAFDLNRATQTLIGGAARVKLTWVLCTSLLAAAVPASAMTVAERFTLSAQVWGLAKYRHPAVTTCQRSWDQALIDVLPAVEAADEDARLDAAISSLLQQAGSISPRTPDAQTPQWIVDAPLSTGTKATLAGIAAVQPTRQCYINADADADGRTSFRADNAFSTASPTRNVRLLAAFRFWNAVEYFFAYRSLIGRNWASALTEHVLTIADAPTDVAYVLAMRQFTAEINDSHGYMSSALVPFQSPPFQFTYIDGDVVVTETAQPARGNVNIGDVIKSINGEPIASAVARRDAYGFGSNPSSRRNTVLQIALGGEATPFTYQLERQGVLTEGRLTPGTVTNADLRASVPAWRTLPVGPNRSCTATVITLDRYTNSTFNAISPTLAAAQLLVVDARSYPSNAYFEDLINNRLPILSSHIAYSIPDFSDPGAYLPISLIYNSPAVFNGRIVILVNENTISAAEFQSMLFQGRNDTLIVGSQTAGADGDIIDGVFLPGNIQAEFSGNRVAYADGRHSQRFGIVPDIHVRPTLAGIRAGRDEVMEAALDCQWADRSVSPSKRKPRGGLYFDAARDGEGVEVHRLGNTFAFASYSYDQDGFPQWAYGVSDIQDGTARGPLLRGTSALPVGNLEIDYQRGPYSPTCAVADQSRTVNLGTMAWPIDAPTRELCMRPLLLSDSSPYSGLWSGDHNDLGWGLSLHHADGILVLSLYAYDAAGKARWAVGTAQWSGQGPVTVPMLRSRGFCNTCAPTPPQFEAAGTITLDLTNPSSGILIGNTASIDVRFHDQGHWLRQQMPLRKL